MLAVGLGLLLRSERPATASSVCSEPDENRRHKIVDSAAPAASLLASTSEGSVRFESERAAAPTHSSVLRGRLVYRSTAQGVPFGEIDVESDDVIVTTLTTDREGRFESDRARASALRASERRVRAHRRSHVHAAG
jgi:hypothetical protein